MDLKQYVQDAIRTESRIDTVTTDRALLTSMLKAYIASGNVLDMIKKNVFYGKPIDRNKFNNYLSNIINVGIQTEMFSNITVNGQEYTTPPSDIDIDPRLFHSLIGILTESTELAEALLKIIVTGKSDDVNILEEFGDIGWYEAIGIDTLDGDFETILNTNIEKLRQRFPEKFTSEHAIDRDLINERQTLEQGLSEKGEVSS